MRIFLSLLFGLFTFLLSAAEPGIITGRVSDQSTLEPLPGATIIFRRNQGTTTDSDGNYTIRTEPGSLSITFQYVGYKSQTSYLNLKPGETVIMDVGLEADVTEIDQVVVSANKVEQRISELTVSLSIIRPELVSGGHITNTQELLNKTSGVEVLDGQASIRGGSGFSYGAGSRVLALVDGLPILAADAGNIKWNSLPLENLSQVEIIKGASSVLYGSSALNGVINFRTADPGPRPETMFYAETGIFDQPRQRNWIWWDSPRMFSSASLSHMQKYGNTDISLGSFLIIDNGYRRLNDEKFGRLNLKLRHYSRKMQGLSYGFSMNTNMSKKTDFILWENAETGALKHSESTAIALRGSFLAFDPFISYRKPGRFQHDLRSRLQVSQNRFPESAQNDSRPMSFLTDYQSWFRVSEFVSINAGLYGYASKIESNFYGDHNALNLAAFAQTDITPFNRLKLVAGVRMEYNELDGESDKLVPLFRAGLNYRLLDFTFLRASFGQGYRTPAIAEKFAATTLGSVVIIPNPFLKSESGWNTEIGIKQGIMTSSMNGLIDIALFYSQNIDLIEFVFGAYPEGLGFRATNIEASRVYGLETEIMLNNSFGRYNYTVTGGYVFMYPVEFDPMTGLNTDVYLKFRRKHSAKLNISTSYKRYELGLGMYARSRILNIDDVFVNPLTREAILPGFFDYWIENNSGHFVMDATLGYKLTEQLNLSWVIKNLTNAEYMGRPGDIQPHRSFSMRLSGRF